MADMFEEAGATGYEHRSKPMFPYQDQGVRDIRSALARGNRRVLYQLSTGGGKTRVVAEIVKLAKAKGSKAILLAPRRELVYQIRDALRDEGVSAGIIMAGERPNLFADIHVCSFDTLMSRAVRRNKIQLPPADLVVVDEAHLAVADGRQEILTRYDRARHVLVTATPARADGRGLNEIADELVFGPTMQDLIDLGRLVPLRYFAPSEPDLRKLRTGKDGDYVEKSLGKVMDTPKLVGDIVENWMRLAGGSQTVVFAVNRAHSRHLAEEFKARGVRAEHLDGETEAGERADILRRVGTGETQVLCNVFVASYGLDIPSLECCVLARPTKSLTLYLQMVGRVMRAFPGKTEGLVIDHAGAVRENGFADDAHPWSLDSADTIKERMLADKQAKLEPKQIVCSNCGAVFKSAHRCPRCGHEMIHPTAKLPTYEAELQEIERPKGKETAAEKRNRTTPVEAKRQFYGELKQYASDKGKSDGWVSHTYKSAFGVWPNHHRDAPPMPVTEQTRKYIQSRSIAFARGKR